MKDQLKTWVEVNKQAARANFKTIKSLLTPKTKLWAVVKSNAYGHGLLDFSKLVDEIGVDGFCVDSVVEGSTLRDNYIKKPILVLGPTLPNLYADALQNDITITISNWESLNSWLKSKYKTNFHLKIDTGMQRQGFYIEDLSKVIKTIKSKPDAKKYLKGIYTHLASAKDINYPTYTDSQFEKFLKSISALDKAGFKNITKHASATAGTFLGSKYHLDAVRIGIGLYGLWPSKELQIQLSDKIKLKPVLSWRALVSEIKNVKAGEYIGYDLTEKVSRTTKMAVIPIGYWHGLPRLLSGVGEVLINGKRAKILGRVSMDLIVVNVTNIACKVGSIATIIGQQKDEEVSSYELGMKTNTTHYEVVTRINPLIKRVIQ